MVKFFDRLTQSCQSGRRAAAIAGMALVVIVALPAAAQPGWAHQAAGFKSNGQVTVKSLSGGSYAGTQNPTGAVAKTNQSAATQPPTVIVQATSSGYQQARPMINHGTATVPPCLLGYTSVFSTTSSTYDGIPVFNIGQTRFTFGFFSIGGNNWYGFLLDGFPGTGNAGPGSPNTIGLGGQSMLAGQNEIWGVNLCVK